MAQDECWTRVLKHPVNGSLSYWLPRPCALGVLRLVWAANWWQQISSTLSANRAPGCKIELGVVSQFEF